MQGTEPVKCSFECLVLLLGAVCCDGQAEGQAALDKLEKALVEFQAIIDAKDKQVGPLSRPAARQLQHHT